MNLQKLAGLIVLAPALFLGCSKAGSADIAASGGSPTTNRQPVQGGQKPPGSDDDDASKLATPVGTFRGFIQHLDPASSKPKVLGVTPISIDLRITYPQPNQTRTTETINVGFFGGVTIQTDAVTYDPATATLTATYGTGTNPLRVIARYNGRSLLSAVLSGSNVNYAPIKFLPRDDSNNKLPHNSGVYDLAFSPAPGRPGKGTGVAGRLVIVPLQGTAVQSNGASDLPLLPALNVSVPLDGTGNVVTTFPKVIYDPLRATIELTLANNNMFRMENVYISDKDPQWGADPQTMKGRVLQGSSEYATLSAKASTTGTATFANWASKTYRGTLTSAAGTLNVTAVLVNQNQTGNNTADYIIPLIPIYELQMFVCRGTEESGRLSFQMTGLEPIYRQAKFTELFVSSGNVQSLVNFGPNWSSMTGTFHSVKGNFKFDLSGAPNADCR